MWTRVSDQWKEEAEKQLSAQSPLILRPIITTLNFCRLPRFFFRKSCRQVGSAGLCLALAKSSFQNWSFTTIVGKSDFASGNQIFCKTLPSNHPEADCSIFTLLGVIDVTIHSPSLIFLLPFSFFSSSSSLSPPKLPSVQ